MRWRVEKGDVLGWTTSLVITSPLLVATNSDAIKEGNLDYQVWSLKSNQHNPLTSEELSNIWGIGMNTDKITLMDTMYHCIWSMGFISTWFHTDKAQVWYKQLTSKYGKFYNYYLRVVVLSVRQFIGGTSLRPFVSRAFWDRIFCRIAKYIYETVTTFTFF